MEIVDPLSRLAAVMGEVAALENDVRFDRPLAVPHDRGSAARRQLPRWRNRLPAGERRIDDVDLLREGADSQRIPGLGRIVDRLDVVPNEVIAERQVDRDVAGREDDEPPIGFFEAELIDRRRPGGRTAPGGRGACDRAGHDPLAPRRLDLGSRDRLTGDRAVKLRIVRLLGRRQDADALQPERRRHSAATGKDRHEIAIERDTRHSGAVALPSRRIVWAPGRVDRVPIVGCERRIDQRVRPPHTAVQQADRHQCIRVGRHKPVQNLVAPGALLRAAEPEK